MQKPAPEMAADDPIGQWRRDESARFVFGQRHFNPASGCITLGYVLDDIHLTETFQLPSAVIASPADSGPALEQALDLLHWIAGVSYWKAGCPAGIHFEGRSPDAWQAAWLTRLYREGLAEFAWRNGLDGSAWPQMPSGSDSKKPAGRLGLDRRSLVPMGGGKDSLVALERLLRVDQSLATVQVGNSSLIQQVAGVAGQHHLVVERRMDPALRQLNRAGAWNGHVPVTAINAAVLIVAALVLGYGRIVFANERSADEATLIDQAGRAVNHQFSKSLVFEQMLADWTGRYIATDLAVFSILRRDRELAICREFAGLTRYHGVFSSCNRNFHLDGPRTSRWCGQCPKCHFVFLALAPFMSPERLTEIFGRDLLNEKSQHQGFRALLALDGTKPFECVGEAMEARAALAALAADPRWRGHRVVKAMVAEVDLAAVPDIETLCRQHGDHLIPDELLAHT